MKTEIILKLKEFLGKNIPMAEECHVVYLMVQLRKLIEKIEGQENFQILRFYCNWAVHTEKSRDNSAIGEIVDRIDKDIAKSNGSWSNLSLDFIFLEVLLKEMEKIFEKFDLPWEFFQQDNWDVFRKKLFQVLSEQPIILSGFKYIRSICFNLTGQYDGAIVIKSNEGKEYVFNLVLK
jgi:hypothetical protein